MGLISRVSSRTYRNQKSQTKKKQQKWDDETKEAFENSCSSTPLDVAKNWRCFQFPTKRRTTQTPRMPPIGHLHPKPTSLRPHRERVPKDHARTNDQSRRKNPNRHEIPSRFHGCYLYREDQRKLPIDLRHQRPIHRPPNHRRRSFLQTLPSQESLRRKEQRSIPRHTRRTIHPIPKPRLQSR